jgi:hypothetical protein
MAKVFRKAVLAVNSYQSGDGEVTVTTDRLKHWERQFRALTQAGYAVPMHFNHAELDDEEMLKPIAMDSFSKRDTRGAQNTEGRMTDFKVAPDGRSAEITVEILTPSAQEKVEANAVYVSPVIYPEFQDGHGRTYADVITSVDLVDYPVDHSQGPFVPAEPALMGCAIRMGISPKYYQPRVTRMDMVSGVDAGNDTMPPPGDTSGGQDVVAQIVAVLGELGVQLPPDTNAMNIVERLRATMGNGGQGAGRMAGESGVSVATPEIQTMSLQVRNARAFAQSLYQRELIHQLEHLRDTGRMTDEEFRLQSAKVGAQRLSLDQYGKANEGEIEKWVNSRKPIPEGTFQTETYRKNKQSQLARMSVAQPPKPAIVGTARDVRHDAPVPEEDIKAISDLMRSVGG